MKKCLRNRRKGAAPIAKLFCLFCTTLVFAQQSSEGKPFNTLRGFAYNPYGTLGAAPTIADILQKPSDIYGHKFVYVLPTSNSGYSAFDLAGGSALLGFDQSLILGFAKSFYGLSLEISLNKFCFDNNDSYKCISNTNPIDDYISLHFSVPLSNSIIYAYASELIPYSIYAPEEYQDELTRKEAGIGITGGNMLTWDFNLAFNHYNKIEEIIDDDITTKSSSAVTITKFLFGFGYKILQSDRFKFIVGLNNHFYWQYVKLNYQINYFMEDNFRSFNHHQFSINILPNFLGEVVLTKHLLAFVGARHHIHSDIFLFKDYQSNDMEIKYFSIMSYGSRAYAGLRYERENWAVETRLQSDVFGEILSGKNPFISLGAFIWLAF